jgi:archaellum component FlaF (FlaF/FlaG flagellin family)
MASRINFKIEKVSANTSKNDNSKVGFETIITDRNKFYKFPSELLKLPPTNTIWSGKIVSFPIPPGFQTLDGQQMTQDIINLAIYVEDKPASSIKEKHFCHDFPDNQGTTCAQFLQAQSITYYKVDTKTTPFPDIRNCKEYEKIVAKYRKKYNDKIVYYLPTITPNNTVIYIVSDNQDYIESLIVDFKDKNSNAYIIPLNGVTVYIDQWDAWVFFEKVSVNFLNH